MGVQAMKHAALLQEWSTKIAYLNHLLTVLPERFVADPKAAVDDLMTWDDEIFTAFRASTVEH